MQLLSLIPAVRARDAIMALTDVAMALDNIIFNLPLEETLRDRKIFGLFDTPSPCPHLVLIYII